MIGASFSFWLHLLLNPYLSINVDIYVGMIVGASHYMFFLQQYVCYYIFDPLRRMATIDDDKTNTTIPQSKEAGTLRVVGIGFGRTGTVRSRNRKHIWTSLDRESARAFSLDST